MKTKSRTEITVEAHRVLTIRSRSRPAWCEMCGEQTQMVTADEAAIAAQVSLRAIYAGVGAGQLHFIETPGGLLVCLNSLFLMWKQSKRIG